MNNRNEIKWAPFNSLFNSNQILEELSQKQVLSSKPILSEDELYNLEQNLLEAYHTKELIQVSYYFKGMIYSKKGTIQDIEKNNFKIYFQDHSSLYFEQILKIKML